MDHSALLRFSRRVAAANCRLAVIDDSAKALQEAFAAAVAVTVIPSSERSEVRVAGQLSGFPEPAVDLDFYQWEVLRRRLLDRGITTLRSARLDCTGDGHPDTQGFIVVGWSEVGDSGREWDDAAVELAADQLGLALRSMVRATELRRTSRALEEAQDRLSSTRHLCTLGEITSGVAHDFNNALTTILGTTEWLLQDAELEDGAREDLTHIRMASTDAAAYVRRLQEAAHQVPARPGRASSEQLRPAAEADDAGSVDLSVVAEDMPALTKGRWIELANRGVPIEVVVDTEPVSPVRGSAPELRELLQNLIFNSVDAMWERGGRITVRVRETDDQVSVSVVDEGSGVPYEVRPHVFEPFFTTKGSAGCGLGLSVCWRIAQKHGGSLGVESELDRGTTVTLTLPVERAPAKTTGNVERGPARRTPLTVLLIDDQLDVLESVRDMLKVLGHDVEVASDGETGLALLGKGGFDAVVTDLGMPGLDGVAVAKRARELRPDIPVVLLTGWGGLYTSAPPETVSVVLAKPPTLDSLGQALADATSEVAA